MKRSALNNHMPGCCPGRYYGLPEGKRCFQYLQQQERNPAFEALYEEVLKAELDIAA
ncbi:MAG: hypothetical protein K8S24_00090 [Candidatus Aegiribacteria sp.]|nr:hypothetical protein [Candidatus Aegiribacteria sp.]